MRLRGRSDRSRHPAVVPRVLDLRQHGPGHPRPHAVGVFARLPGGCDGRARHTLGRTATAVRVRRGAVRPLRLRPRPGLPRRGGTRGLSPTRSHWPAGPRTWSNRVDSSGSSHRWTATAVTERHSSTWRPTAPGRWCSPTSCPATPTPTPTPASNLVPSPGRSRPDDSHPWSGPDAQLSGSWHGPDRRARRRGARRRSVARRGRLGLAAPLALHGADLGADRTMTRRNDRNTGSPAHNPGSWVVDLM